MNKPYPTPKIENLYSIKHSYESRSLRILLNDLTEKEWESLFPNALSKQSYKKGDYIQTLKDIEKNGFLAEVHIPECRNFVYREGEPIDCSYFHGVNKLAFVYAETLDELTNKINNLSKDYFYLCAEKEKNNN